VCALTPISFDHPDFLGPTIAAIAGEKAGILKPGVPAVVAPQPGEAAAVIERRAGEVGAPLHRAGREWRVEAGEGDIGGGFRYLGGTVVELPPPGLPGRHQIDNAGLAVAVTEHLSGFAFAPRDLRAGLREVEWPARLQRLTRGPLQALLPGGWELWLDGGHNGAAGEALAEFVAGWRARGRPIHLVFGMLDTKEPRQFLRPLSPLVRSLVAVPVPGEHASLSTAAAAEHARAVGISASEAADAQAAVAVIAQSTTQPCRILICGSLYLAGSVLAENG
jgi:dihydrofolate synthase / folylpolyglutamate synthase